MEKKSRNKLIALIIFAILTTAFCVIFIIGGTKVNNDDYVVFGVIGLMIFLTYSIWEIISTIRKQKPNDIEILKTNLANYAFDNLLKESEHYTVQARVENNILVKKIVRWAYFDKKGKDINAVFSIETDKGLYCFQVKGNSVYMIETDVCTSIYPNLLPIDDSNDNKKITIQDVFEIIENNEYIEVKEKRTEIFDDKKAKEMFPFLPSDYLAFLSKYKYIEYRALQIGGFTWKESNLLGNENMQQYLDGYGRNYKVEDWFFIGSDGMGGEYAFSVKNNDGKVYYFDHENLDILMSYANFCEFMFEQLT